MELLQQRVGLRWRVLSSGTTNRRIVGAAVIVGGATAFVSLASIVRDLLIAASFGTSDELDAFLIAISLPVFTVSVLGGAFASALIPAYIQARDQQGQATAQELFSSVMTLGIGFLTVAMAVLALLSTIVLPLLASGFDPAKLALTQRLFYLLLPSILFSGLAAMCSSVLNAGERFGLAAAAPAMVPLAMIGSLLLDRAGGIQALVVGMIGGYALQLYFVAWALTRRGIGFRPRWYGMSSALRQAISQYVPLVIGAALMSSTLLVDQAVAATLAPGSVAAFGYGTKVVVLVVGLGAGALGTAALPYLSKAALDSDWSQVQRTMRIYERLTLMVTLPLTGVLIVFSEPMIEIIFQRGAFTGADTMLVSNIQAVYALQIPFYVLSILCARLLSSVGANRVLLWAAIVGVLVNAVLDFVLAGVFGVVGIALATTMMYMVVFCFLKTMVRRFLMIQSVLKVG